MSFFTDVLDVFFPPLCPLCGVLLSDEQLRIDGESVSGDDSGVGIFGGILSFLFGSFWLPLPPCPRCASLLATPSELVCPRCCAKRQLSDLGRSECGRCHGLVFRFDRAVVLGEYEKDLRSIVLRMKTDKSGFLARAVTMLLLSERRRMLSGKFDLIIPVPSHRKRRWWRGVNSPDLIAGELGRKLGVLVQTDIVKRVGETALQYHLSDRARRRNVEGAFAIKDAKKNLLKGKRILLIDDILTTGATCNEITKILKKAGAKKITVCAIARAVGTFNK
ncbi:MAG: ComF family protein [Planctomycetaceae bacterium]|jgi:ComF family protein|nr:ComF family protein [Planctomycetaceae bacterium]